jgi:hypothetical protein
MKGFTTIVLLACCASSAYTKEKNDLAGDKLRGKVKSVAISGYKLKHTSAGNQKSKVIFTSSSKYNESGNILEFISSAIEDTLEDQAVKFNAVRSIYKYDDQGNLTGKNDYKADGSLDDSSFYKVDSKGSRVDYYTYKADGVLESHTVSEYNIHGDLIELTEYVKDKFKSRTTYTYDSNGNETDEVGFGEDGKIKWKEVLSYDESGRLTEVVDYKEDDSFDARFTYRYDTRGNLAEETEYHSDTSSLNKRTTTKYDLKGEPVEINHFNQHGRLINQIKVDNFGLHFTDIAYNPDGVLKSVISRKYDDKANEIEDDRFFTKDSVRVKYNYKFEYDKTGNWTKNTTSKNGKPIQLTERQIEYYTDPVKKKK